MIGKLQRVHLREVWRHEALDFTCWLEENIDVLCDTLGLRLFNVERERSAGNFSVDLVALDESDNAVIIENQLEKSDHDHLGKLITYLSVIGAKTAVWIVSDPRPEHVSAVSWLNESTDASFYLIKVEAVRISDSPPAPLLTLIVGPSEETRGAGATKRELAERHHLRKEFWTGLLERAKSRTKLHARISPNHSSECYATAGVGGIQYGYIARRDDADVVLYIDNGIEAENAAMFRALEAHQAEIDASFGPGLEWQLQVGKKACRISHRIDLGGYAHQDRWPEIQDAMIDAMIRLDRAFRPHLPATKSPTLESI